MVIAVHGRDLGATDLLEQLIDEDQRARRTPAMRTAHPSSNVRVTKN